MLSDGITLALRLVAEVEDDRVNAAWAVRMVSWRDKVFPGDERRHSDVSTELFALSYQQQVTTLTAIWRHRHQVLGLPTPPESVFVDTITYKAKGSLPQFYTLEVNGNGY